MRMHACGSSLKLSVICSNFVVFLTHKANRARVSSEQARLVVSLSLVAWASLIKWISSSLTSCNLITTWVYKKLRAGNYIAKKVAQHHICTQSKQRTTYFCLVHWKQVYPFHIWFGHSAVVTPLAYKPDSACCYMPVQRIVAIMLTKKCQLNFRTTYSVFVVA